MAQFLAWLQNKKHNILLTCFCMLVGSGFWHLPLFAQTTFQVQNFTQKDGLSSDYVFSIYQDHLGFIWIGTENGLNRFDGKYFLEFRHDPVDPETLDDNWIVSIYEDSEYNLWVVTEKGLNRLDRAAGKIQRIPLPEPSASFSHISRAVKEDESGNLWLGGANKGLFNLISSDEGWNIKASHLNDLIFAELPSMPNAHLFHFSPQRLWFSSVKGLHILDIPSQKFTHYPPNIENFNSESVNKLYLFKVDQSNYIWQFNNQFFSLNTKAEPPQLKLLSSLENTIDKALIESSSTSGVKQVFHEGNTLLVGLRRDLSLFDIKTGQLNLIQKRGQTTENLFPNYIKTIFKDQQGNFWVGTLGSGFYLCQKEQKAFAIYQNDPADPKSITDGQVRSLLEDEEGNLWAAILNHGLEQFEIKEDFSLLKKQTITPIPDNPSALKTNRIIKIINGEDKSIWIGTLTDGVIKMDSSGKKFTTMALPPASPNSPFPNRVWALEKDAQGFIWVGTWGDGLNRIDPNTGAIQQFLHDPDNPNSLINNNIRFLYADPQEKLWIGTDSGLGQYDPGLDQFIQFQHNPDEPNSLSDNLVWAIYMDSKENLWVGTNTGLNLYDKSINGFIHFFEKDGLPDNTIYGIVEDDNGVIWVSTENGMARKLPDDAEAAFLSITAENGLETTAFVPKAYVKSKRSNFLYFGSTNGILAVQPAYLEQDSVYAKLALHSVTRFKRSGKPKEGVTEFFINEQNKIHQFGYQDQSVTFTIADLNRINNRGYRYEYQLAGFNQQWRPLDPDLKLNLTNLPPGKYSLFARAKNIESKRSNPTELIVFQVFPPWWRSIWAYILYLFLLVLIVLAILRFQLRLQFEKQEAQNLKKLDRFKNRLYTNITHEFRTPLTIVSGMVDQIEKDPKRWMPKGLQMIRKNNANLLNLINQMLELQKVEAGKLKVMKENGDIIPFLKNIFEQFTALGESKGLRMEFVSAMGSLFMDYDQEKILRIISNLLSNAIKFTPAKGLVILAVSKDTNPKIISSECLCLLVKDSGQGIPKEQLDRIFDRFFQSTLNEQDTSGSGIGLSLTKELVTLLKGIIEVESIENKGTTFRVLLPITQKAKSVNVSNPIAIQSAILGTKQPTRKKRNLTEDQPIALIVEDNEEIVAYLQICLEDSYKVSVANNGQEGIESAIEVIPDIIISDVMMPKKDGFELCDTLKQDLRTSHIPIILLTAKSDVSSRITGLKYGADDYLAKPFNEEELLVRMDNLLQIRHKLQQRYQNVYDQPLATKTTPTPVIEDAFILQIKAIFENHLLDAQFNLEALSKEMNLSRSNLYRKIKALTGRSPAIYLRALRLQKARQLLLSTNLTVKQVAYDVGFSDPSYFSRSYAEEFGTSPSETRIEGNRD